MLAAAPRVASLGVSEDISRGIASGQFAILATEVSPSDTRHIVSDYTHQFWPLPAPLPSAPPSAAPPSAAPPSTAPPSASESPPRRDRSFAARWSPKIATGHFTPVPEYFLHNLHRLRPHDHAQGLTPLEALVIVQIVSHKWDERAPFPALGTIAERLSVSRRTIRAALERLEDLGYVRREYSSTGGTSRYHFDGLVRAIEALIAEDARKLAAAEAA